MQIMTDLEVTQAAGPGQALRLLARRDGGLDLRLHLRQPLLRDPPQVLGLQRPIQNISQ